MTMKYLTYKAQSVEEMASWLNQVIEEYENLDRPFLTEDLCRCIILVWDKEDLNNKEQ